jgi:RHS repeat-associated protein
MAGVSSKAVGKLENKYKFGGNELQHLDFSDGSGLEVYDFNARQFDAQTGRFHSIDPMSDSREWITPYNYVQNNPILRVDPTGTFDFVKNDKTGEISWNKNANSQETTQKGSTYLGKTLTFQYQSYIDKKTWDGPNPPGGDASGVKLTTTVNITGNENEKGELVSISAGKRVKVGPTPIGTGRDSYPGLGDDQNKFSLKTSPLGGVSLNMEQHGSVSSIEEMGMNLLGYDIVNVAQKLDVNISAKGNVSISAATDVFPSATLKVNGTPIMQYNAPSFKATHTMGTRSNFVDNGMGGGRREPTYNPASWAKRF